jgi:hypothetical protein
MLGQWATELGHVAVMVGSFQSQEKYGGQQGVRFTPLPKEKQAAAVRFLNDNAFATPTWALKPEILRRIEPSGALDRVRLAQVRVLGSLLNPARFGRLVEQEAIDGSTAYKPSEFMADVRTGLWRELTAPQVKIDAYRRNIQRAYLDNLADKLNGRTPATDDLRAMVRAELRTLSAELQRATPRAADRESRAHLEDARDQIARALDPKFAATQPAAAAVNPFGRPGWDDPEQVFFCWPDYAIRPPRD